MSRKLRPTHEQNRRYWDEITPVHIERGDYDVDGFLAGALSLGREEQAAVGDVSGKRLLHLQCHFGLDTLSWARLWADVVGVDFSEPAVIAARELATKAGLAKMARFVQSDVLSLDEALNEHFDIVFTSIGAICWMSDIDRWGEIVARYVSPSGFFYVLDDHPLALSFDTDETGRTAPVFDYFSGPEPLHFHGLADYSCPEYTPAESELSHIWPVSAVMHALERNDMLVSEFQEFPYMRWMLTPDVRRDVDGNYCMPGYLPDLPMMYSFKARHRQ